jgi:esterase/lipase superfamily enzyme
MRYFPVLLLAVLVACAPRGVATLMPEAAAVGVVETVFVGSTRAAGPGGRPGPGRSELLTFGRADISVPPLREAGSLPWPPRGGRADPRRHLLLTDERGYPDAAAFRAALALALAGAGAGAGGEAVIFVHGFNTTYDEGLFRVAQFAHDLELPGVVVHYTWPSAAEPLGYVRDRDSALFARDGLERLVTEVERAGARRILLVAHSMGAGLAMEALRGLALRGDRGAIARIGGVVLISPDIDVDVFRAQARAVGRLPQPFVIFASDRDRVLGLSARLTGEGERLGSLTDLARVSDLEVTVLDVGAFAAGSGHFTVAESPALIRLLDRIGEVDGAFEDDRALRTGVLPGVVLTVQSATRVILQPVANLDQALTRPAPAVAPR